MNFALGTALSRAKAHSWREADATMVIVAHMNIETMRAERAVPPAMEPTPWVRISMKGYPVGVPRAASMSPMQYNMAMSIAKPVIPFMSMEPGIRQSWFGLENQRRIRGMKLKRSGRTHHSPGQDRRSAFDLFAHVHCSVCARK
jgi:hypothetical protein